MKWSKAARKAIVQQKIEAYRRDAHIIDGLIDSAMARATLPIYRFVEGMKRPEQTGSVVLFNVGGQLFLLTAAHVADVFRKASGLIGYGDQLVNIVGQAHSSFMPPDGNREHDIFDYAVVRVFGDVGKELLPLAITMADTAGPSKEFYPHRGLVIAGFPLKCSRLRDGVLWPGFQCLEVFGAAPQAYDNLSLVPNSHVLMESRGYFYSREGVQKQHSVRGMSGCGVWLVPELMKASPFKLPPQGPRLLGIFTEHRKREALLIATGISYHLFRIGYHYPELGENIDAHIRSRKLAETLQPWKKQ